MATPAMSALIRRRGLYGGLIMSASHNPGGPGACTSAGRCLGRGRWQRQAGAGSGKRGQAAAAWQRALGCSSRAGAPAGPAARRTPALMAAAPALQQRPSLPRSHRAPCYSSHPAPRSLTAHSPPPPPAAPPLPPPSEEDWGIKFNYSSGEPAPEKITDKIFGFTTSIAELKVGGGPGGGPAVAAVAGSPEAGVASASRQLAGPQPSPGSAAAGPTAHHVPPSLPTHAACDMPRLLSSTSSQHTMEPLFACPPPPRWPTSPTSTCPRWAPPSLAASRWRWWTTPPSTLPRSRQAGGGVGGGGGRRGRGGGLRSCRPSRCCRSAWEWLLPPAAAAMLPAAGAAASCCSSPLARPPHAPSSPGSPLLPNHTPDPLPPL